MKLILSLALLVSCFQAFSATDRWVTPDFFVTSRAITLDKERPQDCRAQITQAMCLVSGEMDDNWESRPCEAGGQSYAQPFLDIYDQLPASFQKMFCSIRKINIETTLDATGYGGMGKNGPVIGLRKSLLDTPLSFSKWASWKEQIMFGGDYNQYDPTTDLPHYVVTSAAAVDDFLFQFLIHEIGHIFDFANELNKGPCEFPEVCEFNPETWGALSWKNSKEAHPEYEFPHRGSLCFYNCQGNFISRDRIPEIYLGIAHGRFVNGYASTQAWDDFADSLAYYAVDKYLNGSVHLHTGQGEHHDLLKKLKAPIFAEKLEFIETFLNRTDIVYP